VNEHGLDRNLGALLRQFQGEVVQHAVELAARGWIAAEMRFDIDGAAAGRPYAEGAEIGAEPKTGGSTDRDRAAQAFFRFGAVHTRGAR